MEDFTLTAMERETLGRSSSKKLRRQGLLPVNIYGHKLKNRHVSVDYREFQRFIDQGHRIFTLVVSGEKEHGVVREIQYDHLGSTMIHADITRVDLAERIVMSVPVVTVGVAKGLSAGGTLDISLKELHISGPANALPEKYEIRVADLSIHDTVRIRDLEVPAGCKFDHEEDAVVLAIHTKRPESEEEVPAEEPAEPEVISRKKEEGEGADEEGGDKK